MTRSRILVAFATLALLTACGGKANEAKPTKEKTTKKTSSATKKTTAAKPAPTKKTTATPTAKKKPAATPVDPEAAKACNAILAKSWEVVQPAMKILKIAPTAELKTAVTTNKNLLAACVLLSKEKRDCMTKAANPITAIDTCAVNAKGVKKRLYHFSIAKKSTLLEPKPITKADADKIIAWLKGTWVNEWKAINEVTTWTIGEGGVVTTAQVTRKGKLNPKASVPSKVSMKNQRRLTVRWKGSTTDQHLAFFKGDANTFYASTNGLYDAYPVANQKNFVVRIDWDYVTYNNGKCQAINSYGVMVDAQCKFGKKDGEKTFEAVYTWPGSKYKRTKRWIVKGNHFLHSSLFNSAYNRKK